MQPVERVGDFDRVEVLALDILDERDLHEAVISEFLHDDRNFLESGNAGGAEAALSGDELIAIACAADDERLDDAVFADGLGELLETFR